MAKDAKKKKRSHKDSETKDNLACPSEERDSDSKDRRKTLKKKKRKDVETSCQDNDAVTKIKKHKHCDVEASSDVLEEIPVVKKKKKKKHKKRKTETVDAESGTSDVETDENASSVVVSGRKKHKKHKKSVADESLNEPELCAGRQPGDEELNDNSVTRKKSKKRVGDGSANETKHTKFKKHKRQNGADDGVSNVAEVNGIEKKRKKKTKVETVQLDNSSVGPEVKTSKKEKKQKKPDMDLELSATSEPNGDDHVPAEKKRKKKHREEADKCAKVCDESTRLELGGTLDTKQPKDGATSRFLGQWGTAELDTGERQNKFLRLLGGFKASSAQKAAPSRHCVNSALNASGENQLNKTLETQFDNAMNYRVNMQRGGGLGYSVPPGENKKFHIDSTSSKSVKFDD